MVMGIVTFLDSVIDHIPCDFYYWNILKKVKPELFNISYSTGKDSFPYLCCMKSYLDIKADKIYKDKLAASKAYKKKKTAKSKKKPSNKVKPGKTEPYNFRH